MYDITSIYFEGDCCPLTKFGYNRDGKKGKKQIVVGMLTDSSGRPLGVRVFEGNTRDASTVLEQMSDVKTEFGVDEFTRPVRDWNAERVKGHVFMCMLAYLVIWTAGNAFAEFLERDETCMCEGGSLREIWEELDRGITIGTLSFGGEKEDQLSPIPNYQKRLLKAAKASINKKEKERLRVV